MDGAVVRAEEVSKTFHLGRRPVAALRSVSLALMPGEFAALMGPSGSGKSTLLNLMAGLDRPGSGRIFIAGQDVSGLGRDALAALRLCRIGLVFQFFNLFPVLNVFENVEYPLVLNRTPGAERRRRVGAMLERLEVSGLARHRPEELSGGQRQRVAIARALVMEPEFVLADEPTANLDSATGGRTISLLRQLNREKGISFLLATHDQRIVDHADRVHVIRDGGLQGP